MLSPASYHRVETNWNSEVANLCPSQQTLSFGRPCDLRPAASLSPWRLSEPECYDLRPPPIAPPSRHQPRPVAIRNHPRPTISFPNGVIKTPCPGQREMKGQTPAVRR